MFILTFPATSFLSYANAVPRLHPATLSDSHDAERGQKRNNISTARKVLSPLRYPHKIITSLELPRLDHGIHTLLY
ncbi:exported protein of unknown function [Legionella fallonii LLAP-10]|uniref:Uncharacterized protein n=1 Tax=Legionella fallonii LLAP-10 TaxID=1212491 RepID=A0A098GAR4_9GAMM|nr:exported protein of unknown function [Legionella fallonii LLAP-10]